MDPEIIVEELVDTPGYIISELSGWLNIYNGYSSFSRVDGVKATHPVSFYGFGTFEEAKKVQDLWGEYEKIDGCLKVYEIVKMGSIFFLVIERVYQTFGRWLKSLKMEDIWKFDAACDNAIEMGPKLKLVFRYILEIIQQLHRIEKSHGNLEIGISINHESSVKLFFYEPKESFHAGLTSDIEAVVELVKKVARKFPDDPDTQHPSILRESFELVYQEMSKYKYIWQLRDFAYFMFNHPLFWGGNERYAFSMKAHGLRNRHYKFDKDICAKSAFVKFGKWTNQIAKTSVLYSLLTYDSKVENQKKENQKKRRRTGNNIPQAIQVPQGPQSPKISNSYKSSKPAAVLSFFRHAFHHFDRQAPLWKVDQELQEVFPNVIPKAYYGIIKTIYPMPQFYKLDSSLAHYLREEFPRTNGKP